MKPTTEPTRYRLVIADDGHGFDPEASVEGEERHSYGLAGIRERAELIGARLGIVSRPGTGTTVEVIVPHPANRGLREVSEKG